MADTDIQGMLVRIEATTAQLRQEMARADSSVAQASGKIDKSLGRIDESFDRAGESAQNAAGLIKSALGAAIGVASIGKIIEAADSYGQMSDRIGMATASVGEYDLVQGRLLETAKRTYRPLSEAQELYIRTADSLRSMGYDTGQALDVMDSFSFLLVTNSASANKASAAIDAYSKALQTGKVEADGWQSILAAMPTVVDTIAKSTGKTAEEIRSLGAQGKLGLDILTSGLQKAAEANGILADSMSIAVRDAVQNLSNSFTVYIGRLNETADFTGVLGRGISALGNNFETLADIAIVAAIAALTRYGVSSANSAAVATYAAFKDAAARKAQAAAILLAAEAEQQKARTSVVLAEREAFAARGTAVQTQMSIQLAEARMVEARATSAVSVAQAGLSRTSGVIMGVLGGPLGIASLAIGAATAFLTLRDNTSVLKEKLGDLSAPLDQLIKKFNELGRATQSVTLRQLRADIENTQRKVEESSSAIADRFENSLRSAGAAGQDGGLAAGFVQLPKDAKAALDIVRKASKDAKQGVIVDWDDVANQVRKFPSVVSESMAQEIETSAGNVEDLTKSLTTLKEAQTAFTTEKTKGTQAQGQNAAADAQATEAGEKYLEQLDKQLATLQDKTAAEAAERVILNEKIDTNSQLAATIRARAKAVDDQKAADDAAAKASKKNASAGESAAKQQLKSFESTEESYKRQIDLINTTGDKQKDATEVAKLSFELQEGKLGKLTEAQKKRLLAMAAELDALNKIKKANEDDLKLTAFKAAQATGTQTTQDGFDQELAGIGMGDKARDRMRADLALRQKYAADVASLNEQRNTGQISPELYASESKVLQDELGKRLLAQQNYYSQVDAAQSNWANGASDALQDYVDQAADVAGQTKQLFTSAFSGLEDGIVNFVKTGKLSFKDMADSIIEDLIRIQVRQAAAGFLSSALGAFTGGGGGTGIMTGFSEGAMVPNAKGGVYSSASLSSYSGGVYNTPQTFAFAKGAGIFAEAGPEAIMPLTRAADGSLGVRAVGGSGATAAEPEQTWSFGGITQHISVQGNADEATLARIQEAARRGAEGGYQMMLKDLKQNGPARQLINRR